MSPEAAAHSHAPTVSRSRLPDPGEPIPDLAAPTVALFVAAVVLFGGSTALALSGSIPYPLAIAINTIASYMFFTVLHDASHRTISQRDAVNRWLGLASAPFVSPLASYSVFRFIHMQHHRFTNHDRDQDPDAYTSNGPAWSWPLRWATLDISYLSFYIPRLGGRPRGERVEFVVNALVVGAALVAFALAAGVGALLLLVILPTRLTVTFLGFAFDWLPHHGLEYTPEQDRYKTTRNRVGLEWLMTPVLIYQNYHLVHHLHPLIPFYRYLVAWRRNEDAYLEHDPPLVTPTGHELSVEEYRRRRGLGG
jgi:fatty acid desaturase